MSQVNVGGACLWRCVKQKNYYDCMDTGTPEWMRAEAIVDVLGDAVAVAGVAGVAAAAAASAAKLLVE